MPSPKRKEFPDFAKTPGELKRLEQNFLLYAGNSAVNFFQDSFRRKGFIDKGYKAWKERKPSKGKKKAKGSLLVVSGRLKNSIRITNITSNEVAIGTDIPYAEVHNEGFKGTVQVAAHTRKNTKAYKVSSTNLKTKKKTTRSARFANDKKAVSTVKAHSKQMNMDKRQFIGESELLIKRVEKNLEQALDSFIDKILP